MKILCLIPFFADPEIALHCYQSFQAEDVDFFLVDDNAKDSVKQMIKDNNLPINVVNPVDRFATGCWNQAFYYFKKHPEYDCLRIGFSDVIMKEGWKEVLEANWNGEEAVLATFSRSLEHLNVLSDSKGVGTKEETHAGTIADCVFLPRKLVDIVFPIPEAIKLWYNDEYMFTILRSLGYKVVIVSNLHAYHYGSLIIQGQYAKESQDQIAKDQENWAKHVKQDMIDKINRLKIEGRIHEH